MSRICSARYLVAWWCKTCEIRFILCVPLDSVHYLFIWLRVLRTAQRAEVLRTLVGSSSAEQYYHELIQSTRGRLPSSSSSSSVLQWKRKKEVCRIRTSLLARKEPVRKKCLPVSNTPEQNNPLSRLASLLLVLVVWSPAYGTDSGTLATSSSRSSIADNNNSINTNTLFYY